MTLFRDNKTGILVTIYRESPRMFTGRWYNAYNYFTGKFHGKHINLDNYTTVATANGVL